MHTQSKRVPYVRRCRVLRDCDGVWTEGVLCGVGPESAYVTFLHPLDRTIPASNETLRVSFLLPGDPVPVETDGIVTSRTIARSDVHGPPPGCEVRFAGVGTEDRQRIVDLVRDYREARQPRIAVTVPFSGFIRMLYVEPCLLVGASSTWPGVVCNLSIVGAYVTMAALPAVGLEACLFFNVPARREPLELCTEVAWVNPDEPRLTDNLPPGCGLRFVGEEGRGQVELLIAEYESVPRD